VSRNCEFPSHFTQKISLGDWLKSQGVPAMCGVDTRSLTRYLREYGTLEADLLSDDYIPGDGIKKICNKNVLEKVVPKKTVTCGISETKILFIDTGAKENIIRSFVNRGVSLIRAPWNTDWEKYLPEVDGVFFANGPGDPMDAGDLVHKVRNVFDTGLPIFGICFGNQLISLAAGAKTVKMKYGHRSVNQPVCDLLNGKCYITSQNHGYVVDNMSLSEEWEPWFVNLNDGSNEGIRHKNKPICAVQFHPEARPGPNDMAFLFDDFIATVRSLKREKKTAGHFAKLTAVHVGLVA
jgi:carbamoyl-phosphate synthase small subunit